MIRTHSSPDTEHGNTFLLELTDSLHSLDDPLEIQSTAVRRLGERLAVNRVFYAEITNEKRLIIRDDFVRGAESLNGHDAVEFLGPDVTAKMRRGQTVIFGDPVSDSRLSEEALRRFTAAQATSYIATGVVDGECWRAAFVVQSANPREWTPIEIKLVRETAYRTWAAVKRARADQAVRASLAAKEEALRQVHHRTRATLQLITSLINLQANSLEGDRMFGLLDATRDRIYAIATIYDVICRSNGSLIDFAAHADALVRELCKHHEICAGVTIIIKAQPVILGLDRALPLALLLNELVSNVCKHAFPEQVSGTLNVRIRRENDSNVLMVADDGIGLPPGLDYYRPESLGLQLIQMLARQLGGSVAIDPGPGTRVRVSFPVHVQEVGA